MPQTLANSSTVRQRVISETRPKPAKADLRKTDTTGWWAEIGGCLLRAKPSHWTLEMLADRLGRDARQVRRWTTGDEQTQVAVVFSVEELRQPFVIELARLAECEVVTEIRVRRTL